jgi:cell wall-associated NlpC family hydrolase
MNRKSSTPLLVLIGFALASLLLSGCASNPSPSKPARLSVSQVMEASRAEVTMAQDADSDLRMALIGQALAQLNTPYNLGGSHPNKGFDCSGLVQYTYGTRGISVPRTAANQYGGARQKKPEELLPGDLVFFRINRQVDHVGIYLGAGEFIHAPRTGSLVRMESIHNPYWRKHLQGIGSYL